MRTKRTLLLISLLTSVFLSACNKDKTNYVVKTLQPYYTSQSTRDNSSEIINIPVCGLNDASIIEEVGVQLSNLENVSYDKANQPRDLPLDKQIMNSLGKTRLFYSKGMGIITKHISLVLVLVELLITKRPKQTANIRKIMKKEDLFRFQIFLVMSILPQNILKNTLVD